MLSSLGGPPGALRGLGEVRGIPARGLRCWGQGVPPILSSSGVCRGEGTSHWTSCWLAVGGPSRQRGLTLGASGWPVERWPALSGVPPRHHGWTVLWGSGPLHPTLCRVNKPPHCQGYRGHRRGNRGWPALGSRDTSYPILVGWLSVGWGQAGGAEGYLLSYPRRLLWGGRAGGVWPLGYLLSYPRRLLWGGGCWGGVPPEGRWGLYVVFGVLDTLYIDSSWGNRAGP